MIAISNSKSQSNLSLYQHVDCAKNELRTRINGVNTIYLDLMFWIHLRNHRDGRLSNLPPQFDKFAQLLFDAVQCDKVICPISEHLLFEVSKQHDESTRYSTISVMNDFSRSIALIDSHERYHLELFHLLHKPTHTLTPRQSFNVWTKAAYVMGEQHPVPNPDYFDQHNQLAIQKGFFNRMWGVPLIEFLGGHLGTDEDYERFLRDLSKNVTIESRKHTGELNSYRDAFNAECVGAAEILCDNIFDDVLAYTTSETATQLKELGASAPDLFRNTKIALMVAKLQSDKGHMLLPSAYVKTSLHASRRWDKTRAFVANDHYDFDHATAALPYCDAFFTEHSLRNAIKENNVALDKKLGCFVTSSVDEAIQYLENL